MYKVAWMSLPSYWSADVRHNVMPPDVWAAFLLHHAEGGSGNCRNQAISLKTPSMSEIAILRQQSVVSLRLHSRFPVHRDFIFCPKYL